jgi:hypothetical protein
MLDLDLRPRRRWEEPRAWEQHHGTIAPGVDWTGCAVTESDGTEHGEWNVDPTEVVSGATRGTSLALRMERGTSAKALALLLRETAGCRTGVESSAV